MDAGTLSLNGDWWMAYEELPLGYDSPLYRISDNTIERVDGEETGLIIPADGRFLVKFADEQWEMGFNELQTEQLTFNIIAGPDVGFGVLRRDGEWADEFRAAAQEYRLRPRMPLEDQLAGFKAALAQPAD